MVCKVTLLFLFGLLELRVLNLVTVLACWAVAASRVEKSPGFGIRAELRSYKVNAPILRRDLRRIKLGRPAWDGAFWNGRGKKLEELQT
eukprot:1154159-Pelagomonas_calceolata.AAC.1